MNIIVIDDDKDVLDSITNMVSDKKYWTNTIGSFASIKELEKAIKKEKTDVLFIDIKLGNQDGIDFVKNNRDVLENTDIVYITGYDEYIEKVFETDPLYLLMKPITKEKIEKVFNKIEEKNKNTRKYINIKSGKDINKINTNNILYIESFGRTVEIHLSDNNNILSYSKISALLEELPSNFIRTHKSYIVNLEKIKAYNKKEVILKNDIIIPISRLKSNEIRKMVMDYIKDSD